MCYDIIDHAVESHKIFYTNMRNIVWQTRERIIAGEEPPLKELLRTFWYMYIKPTLSRAGALANETDQYVQLIDNIVYMVKEIEVM